MRHDDPQAGPQAGPQDSPQDGPQADPYDPYVEAARTAARYQVRRLRQTVGLCPTECEDLEQDLVLAALVRRRHFDPRLSSARTFTGLVCRHRAGECLQPLMRDRALLRTFEVRQAANDETPLDATELAEAAGFDALGLDASGYGATGAPAALIDPVLAAALGGRHRLEPHAALSALLDLERAAATLPAELATLLGMLLRHEDVGEALEESGKPPASFYRQLRALRMHLRMFGINAAA